MASKGEMWVFDWNRNQKENNYFKRYKTVRKISILVKSSYTGKSTAFLKRGSRVKGKGQGSRVRVKVKDQG